MSIIWRELTRQMKCTSFADGTSAKLANGTSANLTGIRLGFSILNRSLLFQQQAYRVPSRSF